MGSTSLPVSVSTVKINPHFPPRVLEASKKKSFNHQNLRANKSFVEKRQPIVLKSGHI
jgi:hypothetical protein